MKRIVLNYIIYIGTKILILLFRGLPQSLDFTLGNILGKVAYYISFKYRQIVKDNLKVVYPNWSVEKIKDLTYKIFYFQGQNFLEFLRIPFYSREEIQKKVEIKNEENLKDALCKGKGVILLSAHIGNWELAAAKLAASGYPVVEVIRNISNKFLDDYVCKVKKDKKISLISRDVSSLSLYLRTLRENKVLILAVDQHAGSKGVKTEFLGKTASCFGGWVAIAHKTGAAVVPAFAVKEDGYHKIYIEKEIPFTSSKSSQEDVYNYIKIVNGIIENYIKNYPEQWFWFHKRWREEVNRDTHLQVS